MTLINENYFSNEILDNRSLCINRARAALTKQLENTATAEASLEV